MEVVITGIKSFTKKSEREYNLEFKWRDYSKEKIKI